VYVTSPEFASSLKVSLHVSGDCHLAFSREREHDAAAAGWDGEIALQRLPKPLASGTREREGRFNRTWKAAEPAPGIRMPLHVAVPSGDLTAMASARFSPADVLWVEPGPHGSAVIISIATTDTRLPEGEWPGRLSPGTTLVRSHVFSSGRTLWVLGLMRMLTASDEAWLTECARVPLDPRRRVDANALDKHIPRIVLPCVEGGVLALWDVDRAR
jgi:hypothetical protein